MKKSVNSGILAVMATSIFDNENLIKYENGYKFKIGNFLLFTINPQISHFSIILVAMTIYTKKMAKKTTHNFLHYPCDIQ